MEERTLLRRGSFKFGDEEGLSTSIRSRNSVGRLPVGSIDEFSTNIITSPRIGKQDKEKEDAKDKEKNEKETLQVKILTPLPHISLFIVLIILYTKLSL